MTNTKPEKNNPTVQDVARAANVSTATVSRALSAPERVSEKARKRVSDAVKLTGYVINHSARNLRRRQTGTIVALVPDIGNSHFSNILKGIETVCAENDLNVLIADTRKPSMSRSKLQTYFSRNNFDGIVILDGDISIEEMRGANQNLPPVVTAGEWCSDPNVPVALVDNMRGADLAVSHLIECGHSSIGHVSGLLTHVPGRDRLEGFRATLMRNNIDPTGAWVFGGDYSMEAGKNAAHGWLALTEKPTAVCCASDYIAFGFISTLHQAGVRVPRDVSVVGFDDIDVAGHYIPALTTIHQPRRAVGSSAAGHLLALMDGQTPQERHTRVDPWLVVRDSTRPWAAG
ncbi:MAG: LacI family transcriptional regulator [Hyphomicrobiales bacterium]|nr:LacI family transcriptional regulator [Hyphomicrobiales bacterium]MCP5000197.1 LacI family transcriptional regulator [Hyphomicrobiales bacterium]